MFKIEQGIKYRKKYRKMDCFRKYSICFFKIEKTPNRSSLVVKNNFTFQLNPKLSPSRLFSACKKNKSDQGLSPLERCIPQPFTLPLAIHVSIFVQIIHPLYPGADSECLYRGFKFIKERLIC